jgi:DNA-binding CsgD family transcriptional regulator
MSGKNMNMQKQTQTQMRESLYGFETRLPDLRRAPEGERKTYDIKQLWQRNHEILQMTLLGWKPKEIAALLGIHVQTVSNTVNSELGKKKLSWMRQKRDEGAIDIAAEVNRLLPKCIEVYEGILDGDESISKMQKETADTLTMDIAGHRAPTRTQSEGVIAHLTKDDLEEFKKRGKAAAKASGMLIEVENG